MTTLSHRIALNPTPNQRIALARASGCARVAWNWGLAEWKRQYAAHLADPALPKPNRFAIVALWGTVKYNLFPWIKESPSIANLTPFRDLERAFRNFWAKRAKYPRFKKKGRNAPSFGLSNDTFKFDGHKVRLPVIGWVKMHEALRFKGRIMSGRVTFHAGRWFLSVAVEADHLRPAAPEGSIVGIDLGVHTLATLSDGTTIENPKALRSAEKRLHRARLSIARKQRARDKASKPAKKGERRPISRNLAKAYRKAAKVHARIANVRSDAIHKATTRIAATWATVVIEDLHVHGMTRRAKGRGRAAKAGLNKSILDAGFGEFRRQLEYKVPLHGGNVIVAPRFFASSKTCSACGVKRTSLLLSERTFVCDSCGHTVNRDVNAAINLCTLGARGDYACGGEVRPGDFGCRAHPVEAGIVVRAQS